MKSNKLTFVYNDKSSVSQIIRSVDSPGSAALCTCNTIVANLLAHVFTASVCVEKGNRFLGRLVVH